MINHRSYKLPILLLLISVVSSVSSLEFNQSKIINLASKGEELKEDEGYLFLSLDTTNEITRLIIKPENSGKKIVIKKVGIGKNHALIKLRAGNYYWHSIKFKGDLYRNQVKFKQNEKPIKVVSGIVNYPGSWEFILDDSFVFSFFYNLYLTNKSSIENIEYKNNYPKLASKLSLEYQAQFKDPYLQFHEKNFPDRENRNLINSLNQSSGNRTFSDHQVFDPNNGVVEEIKKLPLIKKYLSANAYSVKSMNPSGEMVLATMLEEDIFTIAVLNLKTFKSYTLLSTKLSKYSYLSDLRWIDNDSVYYKFSGSIFNSNSIVHLMLDAMGNIIKDLPLSLPTNSFLVNPLIYQDNKILLYKSSNLRKVDTTNRNSITFSLKKKYTRNKLFKKSRYWTSDSSGNLRFTITSEFDKKTEVSTLFYWFRSDINNDEWKMIKSFTTDEDYFFPRYITPDNKSFYVVSDEKTDKKSVLAYSTKDFSFEKIVFQDPLINVEGLLIDSTTQQFNGIRYIDKGVLKSKYFDTQSDHLKDAKTVNPNLNLYSVQYNQKAGSLLLFGTRLDSEGAWYIYDLKDKTFIKLLEADPDYEKLEKGLVNTISIKSADGLNIEGFLVQPKNQKTLSPLIVIPHGGPIGIRDYAHNDSVQHFLASKGFATLKVNYRGSEGYGKAFKNLGNQQWGEKIEEDINAMVSHVIENFPISENKICAMGGSYGGYSAIMLSILYPQRYKCAVSLAGVTDLPLKFSSHNWFKAEKTLKKLKEIIGDPDLNLIQLIDKSPVYQFDKVTRPILLFQGEDDTNVTPEHALRFYQVTKKSGKDIELIMLKDEGHSFNNIESQIYYLSKSIEFINKHLKLENK